MDNQPVIKKDFKTFKEAFAALPEATRQHSQRVAEYTKVLFIEAMAVEMRMGNASVQAQLEPEHERAAYLCGLYHDIGKALVPIQYHSDHPQFSTEEQTLYRKHVTDGAAMTEQLDFGEELSALEKKMIRQAMEGHHQLAENGGFPEAKTEKEILLMALLTGFANYLDHKVVVVRSETPFEDVMQELLSQLPEENELHLVVGEAKNQLRKVFMKYQKHSMKIPDTRPFVKRKQGRAFELKYRPVTDRRQHKTVGLLAKMYFKDNKDTYIEYEEVKPVLNKNKLIPQVGRYFLYEAGDMIKRIDTCELPIDFVALELMPTWFTQPKIASVIRTQLSDARMEPGRLLLTLDESLFEAPAKAMITNLERMTKEGLPFMITGWTGTHLPAEQLLTYSIRKVALHHDLYPRLEEEELQAQLRTLTEAGIQLIAGGLDKTKYNGTLNALEITAMCGPLAGDYQTEDEVILGELKAQA